MQTKQLHPLNALTQNRNNMSEPIGFGLKTRPQVMFKSFCVLHFAENLDSDFLDRASTRQNEKLTKQIPYSPLQTSGCSVSYIMQTVFLIQIV